MKNKHIKTLLKILCLMIMLSFLNPFIIKSGAKEWTIAPFDLQKTQQKNIADQIDRLQKSIYGDVKQFIGSLCNPYPRSGNQIHFYLRNNASSDLILTDIVSYLDKKLTHYNFSLEDPEILYQNTIQKFTIPDIPSGEHQYQLKFLFQELPSRRKKEKRNSGSIKGCTFLSDAYCLHQKPIIDQRIIKECYFNFSLQKDQTLSIIISFHDGNLSQMLALPSNALEKLDIDLEIANGFYRNEKYLKCLWILKTIEKNFTHLPHLDETLFLRAECYFQLLMYDEAFHAYQELVQKFPHSDFHQLSMLRLVMIHYLSQKYDEAIADFNRFARHLTEMTILDPARYIAAKSYYHKKNYAAVKLLCNSVPRTSDYFPESQYLLALCCLEKNHFSAAFSSLRKIVKESSSQHAYSVKKGMHHILEHGINRDNLVQNARLLMAKILYQQKHLREALKELTAISSESSFYSSALLIKGLIFFQLDLRQEMKTIIHELSQVTLENQFLADARFYLAHKIQQSGNYTEALSYYQDSLHQCREGIQAVELLQNNPGELDHLFHYIVKNESMIGIPPSSPLSLLYGEIRNYPQLRYFLSQWDNLTGMEAILFSMESLILEPVNNYQKRIHLLSELRKISKQKTNLQSRLDQNLSQLQKIYHQIETEKDKIRNIKKILFSHIKKEVYKNLDLIHNRLAEIQDRTNLEVLMIALQKNYSGPPESYSAEFINGIQRVINAHESFLEKYPQRPYREKILFQLAECYYQKAIAEFQLQLKKAEAPNSDDFPLESRPNFDQANNLYNKILFEFPEGDYTEKTLYALAYAYQEQGVVTLAKVIFQRLASDFPESSLLPEVFLHLGEISFNENKFAEAAHYYERSMKFSELPEQYRNNIYYRLGWAYYQQNHYKKAFRIFTSLTDRYIESGKSTLVDEMIYQLAKIFSEYDSVKEARGLCSFLEGKDYHFRILREYAALLFDQGRMKESIEANRMIIEKYPFHPLSPIMQSEIEKCYLVLNKPKAAHKAREKLISTYGENTAWWNKNPDVTVRKKVSSLIDQSIRNSTAYLLEAKNKKEYLQSIQFYRENLNSLTSEEQVYTITFFLAECLFKTEQYREALVEYERTLENKKFDQFTEDAAYRQILCLEKIIHQKSSTSPPPSKPPSKDWTPEEKKFIAACKYIFRLLPDHENMPEVLYKKGELYFQKNRYAEAMENFMYIIDHFPENTIRLPALKMIAKIHFSQEQFDQAAHVYSQLVAEYDQVIEKQKKEVTKEQSDRQKAHEMIALSKFKAAESRKQKSPLEAAKRFERAADSFPGIKIADEALFESASLYKNNNHHEKALDIFSRILKHYPQSEYAPRSLAQIALYQEKKQKLPEAARCYEKLYLDYPKYSGAAKGLYKAGLLYEKMENWEKVIHIFSIYQSTFHPKPALAIECMFRRGYALMKKGESVKANAAFHGVVDTYNRCKKLDNTLMAYYAAQAKFLISEHIFERYKESKIYDVSDKGRQTKLNLLKKVIENYTEAVDFHLAEWTTPAIFKMGLAMELFAGELQELSAGRRTTTDESAYLLNIQVQQEVIEFLEKAVLFYEKNIFSADNNTSPDQWIIRSQENISKDYWEMGLLKEKIYTLIKEAPVPEILAEKEKRQYREALLAKALPYQDQAIEIYKKNTLAFKNTIIFNPFIAQSYQKLARLRPDKYLRNESRLTTEDRSFLDYPEHLLGID